jgi:hypothetical protein
MTFTKAGETAVTVAAPSVASASALPLATNLAVSGAGLAPTVSWTLPTGATPDAVRIAVFDRSRLLASGSADQVHLVAVEGSVSSYKLPTVLSSGQSLKAGGDYVISISPTDLRGATSDYLANQLTSQVLSRSSAFFNYIPNATTNNSPRYLPTVVNGINQFDVTGLMVAAQVSLEVGLSPRYQIKKGSTDPNITSVLLPTGVEDSLYDLYLWSGTQYTDSGIDLVGGQVFNFSGAGVSQFEIRGVTTAANIDLGALQPFDIGLGFAQAGNFSGSITPLAEVPVIGTLPLLVAGLFLTSGGSRAGLRKRANQYTASRERAKTL